MFPSKGIPGGCGIGVVIVIYYQSYIGKRNGIEMRMGVADKGGGFEGGVVACMKTTSDLPGSPCSSRIDDVR